MVLGQSAATAAAIAIDDRCAVQEVAYSKLRVRLLADEQILEWTGAKKSAAGLDPAKLPGIVIDNVDAKVIGEWNHSASINGFVGVDYLHDNNAAKGDCRAEFTAKIPKTGRYEVRVAYTPNPNRATNVPINVSSADGDKMVKLNQREATQEGFRSLGTFRFEEATPARVVISNVETDGYVIVDAVQFIVQL